MPTAQNNQCVIVVQNQRVKDVIAALFNNYQTVNIYPTLILLHSNATASTGFRWINSKEYRGNRGASRKFYPEKRTAKLFCVYQCAYCYFNIVFLIKYWFIVFNSTATEKKKNKNIVGEFSDHLFVKIIRFHRKKSNIIYIYFSRTNLKS